MDKDRVTGAAKQAAGGMKEVAGKILGDSKLKADGAAEKTEGKIDSAIGGAKDTIRDAVKK